MGAEKVLITLSVRQRSPFTTARGDADHDNFKLLGSREQYLVRAGTQPISLTPTHLELTDVRYLQASLWKAAL